MKRVFISYSHDSAEHQALVLELANRLREDGLDCQIDQYVHGFPPENWQRWMENQLEQADFVLVMCTPTYLRRYRGQETNGGQGANFEGVVISQTLYQHHYRNRKFIPVIPEGGSLDDVPLPLQGFNTYTLPTDYLGLYRLLTNQPATVAPEVGMPKVYPPSAQPSSSKPQPKGAGEKTNTGNGYKHWVKRQWAWLGSGILLLFTLAGGYNDLKALVQELCPEEPALVLTHNLTAPAQVGDLVAITFAAPAKGYVSLWNQAGATAAVNKVLPARGTEGLPLTGAYRGESPTFRLNVQGMDSYLLLWTPAGQPGQLPQQAYPNRAAFMAAVQGLQQRTPARLQTLDIPVFAKP